MATCDGKVILFTLSAEEDAPATSVRDGLEKSLQSTVVNEVIVLPGGIELMFEDGMDISSLPDSFGSIYCSD